MIKESIRLEAIDPIEIYGAANRNLEALCSYFPELKVAARGNEIFLEGSKEDVENFTSSSVLKLSTALISPMQPTWNKSSIFSLRPVNL